MTGTCDDIVSRATRDYLSTIDPKNPPPLKALKKCLIDAIRDNIDLENAILPKGQKLKYPSALAFPEIATVMDTLYHIRNISCAGEGHTPILAMYQTEGENEGIYDTSEDAFLAIARQLNSSLKMREFTEVMSVLRVKAKKAERTNDRDLIAVNNGIFNYKTKELLPFSPDYVFLSKSHVDYIENAPNPVIHNDDDGTDWDVENWIREIADDDEIAQLLWQIVGAIIRPHNAWEKTAWLYSQKGENGKGTLCELMRNLCGPGSYASIGLAAFSREFLLEPLIHASAIINDENSVGEFLVDNANFKAVVTGDPIQLNRKFKSPITFKFHGFMVQCINKLPRIKDQTDSFYRRLLFIPFSKSFSKRARKYIKQDYVGRKEVLEYVLWKVLNMNYYELSEPAACRALLYEYKDFNDPVREFVADIMPRLVWDLIPFNFIYDLYKSWFRRYCPSGSVQSRQTFVSDLLSILPELPDWECPGRGNRIRPGHMMDKPEPLIAEYDLVEWKNPVYCGGDLNKICHPALKESYRGLSRVVAGIAACDDDDAA